MMKTVKNIPELRFPEFEGEWEENTLGEIATITSGGTPNRNIIEYWHGNIPWVTTSLIDFNIINSTEESITNEGLKNSSAKLFSKGTLLMAMYGQGLTRGKVAVLGIDATTNQACAAIIIRDKLNSFFLFYYLSKNYIAFRNLSNDGGQKNLSGGIIKSITIFYPSLLEQQKIASFLSSADQRIHLLTQKKEKLEQYKKGIMQQIFSQQLRFKDENGKDYPDWEEKKISDVFSITRGYVLSFNEIMQEKDEIYKFPVYSSQTKYNGLSGYYYKSLYSNAITWTTDGANAGEVRYREGNFYCTNVCGVLVSKEGYANECIASMLNSVTKKYVSYVGNPKLMNNVMGNISILFPSIDEQQKIASFLSSLDQKISLVNQQIELTRRWKQGLLQKMFV